MTVYVKTNHMLAMFSCFLLIHESTTVLNDHAKF